MHDDIHLYTGVTFKIIDIFVETHLEQVKKGEGSFSYPSMLQAPDGMLHITYSYQQGEKLESIKYVVVNPALILES